MFLDLLMAPITAPISGLSWIAEKILEQAEPELDEKENLSKQLLSLQLAFDMGELSEDEFEEQEEVLLLAIQAAEDEKRKEAAEAAADLEEDIEAPLADLEENQTDQFQPGDTYSEVGVPTIDIHDLNRLVNSHIERKEPLETKVPATR